MTLNEFRRQQPVQWHGVRLNTPDSTLNLHTGATVRLFGFPLLLHIMINAYWEPLSSKSRSYSPSPSSGGYAVSP